MSEGIYVARLIEYEQEIKRLKVALPFEGGLRYIADRIEDKTLVDVANKALGETP